MAALINSQDEKTKLFADELTAACRKRGINVVEGKEQSSHLKKLQIGAGSVVVEFRFNQTNSAKLTGTSAFVDEKADRLDKALALELVTVTADTLGIKNKGVSVEKNSLRKSLNITSEKGTVAAIELGCESCQSDMKSFEDKKEILIARMAEIIHKYELLTV